MIVSVLKLLPILAAAVFWSTGSAAVFQIPENCVMAMGPEGEERAVKAALDRIAPPMGSPGSTAQLRAWRDRVSGIRDATSPEYQSPNEDGTVIHVYRWSSASRYFYTMEVISGGKG
jgi:hypothetical protein